MNFLDDLPVADISLGRTRCIRLYGYSDITPRLVEMRLTTSFGVEVVRLHVHEAEEIAAGLIAAARKAKQQ